MDTPAAEVSIDAGLVQRLVAAQHPDLAGPLKLVAHGWDNAIYRLGDDLCVRLPRRQVAVELTRHEQRWLPMLAEQLSTPIPAPVRVGVPGDGYPWPWTIGPWIDGTPAAELPPHRRASAARDVAEFMAELHVPAPDDAPANPVRGVALRSRTDAVRQRLDTGTIAEADTVWALWSGFVEADPWPGPTVWVHGDPHPANLLLREDPHSGALRLAAVLDFGDLTSGDPATDLAAAWMVFDAAGRAAFRATLDELAGVDQSTWTRARGWALNMGTAIAVHSDDNPRMAEIGRHVLDQVMHG
ncbi:aminoglycoside phosphotransferase family protein [Phytoactinopolyspora halotolerans]|uniref:Aminoglycoside phosphotransferase family protein n=1 Tax=Phytoactinopolyspora halotolerans TaxID=1981512 RepID=A0A6L9SFU7_9ACTN|nr:aminoglycoside phosphotransferase family protein [Phytoactinopolyspora halotolerans]NEE02950.1 aminoglycoside phosphotransferase family protein [Phytoactinopolyspora halotolerans]